MIRSLPLHTIVASLAALGVLYAYSLCSILYVYWTCRKYHWKGYPLPVYYALHSSVPAAVSHPGKSRRTCCTDIKSFGKRFSCWMVEKWWWTYHMYALPALLVLTGTGISLLFIMQLNWFLAVLISYVLHSLSLILLLYFHHRASYYEWHFSTVLAASILFIASATMTVWCNILFVPSQFSVIVWGLNLSALPACYGIFQARKKTIHLTLYDDLIQTNSLTLVNATNNLTDFSDEDATVRQKPSDYVTTRTSFFMFFIYAAFEMGLLACTIMMECLFWNAFSFIPIVACTILIDLLAVLMLFSQGLPKPVHCCAALILGRICLLLSMDSLLYGLCVIFLLYWVWSTSLFLNASLPYNNFRFTQPFHSVHAELVALNRTANTLDTIGVSGQQACNVVGANAALDLSAYPSSLLSASALTIEFLCFIAAGGWYMYDAMSSSSTMQVLSSKIIAFIAALLIALVSLFMRAAARNYCNIAGQLNRISMTCTAIALVPFFAVTALCVYEQLYLVASCLFFVPVWTLQSTHLMYHWLLHNQRWLVDPRFKQEVHTTSGLTDVQRKALLRKIRNHDIETVIGVAIWNAELFALSVVVGYIAYPDWWWGLLVCFVCYCFAFSTMAVIQWATVHRWTKQVMVSGALALIFHLGATAVIFAFLLGAQLNASSLLVACIATAIPFTIVFLLALCTALEGNGCVSHYCLWSIAATMMVLVIDFFCIAVLYNPWYWGTSCLVVTLAAAIAVSPALIHTSNTRKLAERSRLLHVAAIATALLLPSAVAAAQENVLSIILGVCVLFALACATYAFSYLDHKPSFHHAAHARIHYMISSKCLASCSFHHSKAAQHPESACDGLQSLEKPIVAYFVGLFTLHVSAMLATYIGNVPIAQTFQAVVAFVYTITFVSLLQLSFLSWSEKTSCQSHLLILKISYAQKFQRSFADVLNSVKAILDSFCQSDDPYDEAFQKTTVQDLTVERLLSHFQALRSNRVYPVTDIHGNAVECAQAAQMLLKLLHTSLVQKEAQNLKILLCHSLTRKLFEHLYHSRLVSMKAMVNQHGRPEMTIAFFRSLPMNSMWYAQLLKSTLSWEKEREEVLSKERMLRSDREQVVAKRRNALQLRQHIADQHKSNDRLQRIQNRRKAVDEERQRIAEKEQAHTSKHCRYLSETLRRHASELRALTHIPTFDHINDCETKINQDEVEETPKDHEINLFTRNQRIEAKRREQLEHMLSREKEKSLIQSGLKLIPHTLDTQEEDEYHQPFAVSQQRGHSACPASETFKAPQAEHQSHLHARLNSLQALQQAELQVLKTAAITATDERIEKEMQALQLEWNSLLQNMDEKCCCSFLLTGTTLTAQLMYRCVTCEKQPNCVSEVCETCRNRCHAGHNTVLLQMERTYCECGLQPCSSMKPEQKTTVHTVDSGVFITTRDEHTQASLCKISFTNSAVENEVTAILEELEHSNKPLFIDSSFSASDASLFVDESCPHRDDWSRCKWLRVHEVLNKDAELFSQTLNASEVEQGEIGDCWFVSALAVLTLREEAVHACFHPITSKSAQKGMYVVRFYRDSQVMHVIVDDQIPIKPSTADNTRFEPLFVHSHSGHEVWSLLIEKAFAKLNGSYQAIEGGWVDDALVHLTDGSSERFSFADPSVQASLSDGRLWHKILSATQHGFLLGCGSPVGKSDSEEDANEKGIIQSHAYSILGAIDAGGESLIHLRNPWGRSEWTGDWGNKSPLWTDAMKALCKFEAKDDGAFWMSFHDFIVNFDEVYVCSFFDAQAWPCQGKVALEWKGVTAGGCAMHQSVAMNPQLALVCATESTVSVHLELRQADRRKSGSNYPIIILEVYDNAGKRITHQARGKMVINKGAAASAVCVDFQFEHAPGRIYTILPCTYDSGVASSFTVRWFATGPVHVQQFVSQQITTAMENPVKIGLTTVVTLPSVSPSSIPKMAFSDLSVAQRTSSEVTVGDTTTRSARRLSTDDLDDLQFEL